MWASLRKDVGNRRRDVLAAVDRVAQLVQHGPHPVFVGHDIGEHAHVAFAVDVGAERMRALARLFVKVAAGDHVVDRQADAGVEIAAELEDVGLGVNGVEVGCENRRRLLEERVVIVPRAQLVDLDAALLGKLGVDLALELAERLARQLVQLVEQLEHLLCRLLVEKKLKRLIVGDARACGRPRCAA